MSVSPRQNFWKPPPVPEVPTVTRAPDRCLLEFLGDRLCDGKNRARAVYLMTPSAAAGVPVGEVVSEPPPHADGDESDDETQEG